LKLLLNLDITYVIEALYPQAFHHWSYILHWSKSNKVHQILYYTHFIESGTHQVTKFIKHATYFFGTLILCPATCSHSYLVGCSSSWVSRTLEDHLRVYPDWRMFFPRARTSPWQTYICRPLFVWRSPRCSHPSSTSSLTSLAASSCLWISRTLWYTHKCRIHIPLIRKVVWHTARYNR